MDYNTLLKCVEVIYSYLYSLTYGNPKYYYNWNERSILTFNNFVGHVDNRYKLVTLGKNFMVNYFLFHYARLVETEFNRYSSKDSKGNVVAYGRFQIYDFISKKSFETYVHRNKKFEFCISTNRKFDKYVVSVSSMIKALDAIINPNDISFELFEENIKRRYFGTSSCFVHCISETTLYNNDSMMCPKCAFKEECIKLLENKYPKIYKERECQIN
tara:strand:- start:1848 stop:2492 length:645 start_codon:yes stop_codon:yes gene_type:complete